MKKILAVLGALSAGSASAAIVSFSDSHGLATTNWNETLVLQQFDGSLGNLNSVTLVYGGNISTLFRVESLDTTPTTVTTNASASLVFGGPIGDTVSIGGTTAHALGAYDGITDFGGSSGGVFGPVLASDNDSLVLLSGLAGFIGSGSFGINVVATGLSSVSGSGNLLSQINTEALAEITVSYDYTPAVTGIPEPASLALVGLGLMGVAAARHRRRQVAPSLP